MDTLLTISQAAGWVLLVLACASTLGYLASIKDALHQQANHMQALITALETCCKQKNLSQPDEQPEQATRAASPTALRRDSQQRKAGSTDLEA